MRLRSAHWWWVGGAWVVLVAAAGLSSWLFLSRPAPSGAPISRPRVPAQPDYILRDATITRFSDDGTRLYVITSPRIVHQPRDDSTVMVHVTLTYFPATGTGWRLRADHGRLSKHDTLLFLTGHVRARELVPRDPLRFNTHSVAVLLPSERLSSQDRVKLRQGHRETQGTGLTADLKAGTLSLLKDVSSRYAP